MWRRCLALVVLVGALTGCDGGSPDGAAPPTSRTGGEAGDTTSTLPSPDGRFVGVWTGEKDLWALTSEPCPRPGADAARCAVASRTDDSGTSWTRLARLDVGPSRDTTDSVSSLHFADAQHGWAYDRSLFATFNGGRRWQRVDIGNPVVAMESVGTTAYALVGSCAQGVGNCDAPLRLFEGTISTGRWRFLTLGFDLPPTDVANFVVSGSTLYAVVVRGLEQTFLARTSGGRWERRTLPCPRALVAAIPAQDGLVAACRPPTPTGPVELQTSSDGGRTWAVVWQHSFPSPVSGLAVTDEGSLVGMENGAVVRSTDNGITFSTVAQTGAAPALRFSDAEHGTMIAGSPGERQLFRTSNGGASWRAVPPPS